jgi:WD40 repeat protein
MAALVMGAPDAEGDKDQGPRLMYELRKPALENDMVKVTTSYSPSDGTSRLVTGSWGTPGLQIWIAETGEHVGDIDCPPRLDVRAYTSSTGPRVAAACNNGELRIFDGDTFAILHCVRASRDDMCYPLRVYHHPTDGRPRLVTAGVDGELKIWDGDSAALLHAVPGLRMNGGGRHQALLSYFSYGRAIRSFVTPDGTAPRLVVVDGAGTIRICDPEAGSVIRELEGPLDVQLWSYLPLITVRPTWDPEKTLIACSGGRDTRVWDSDTGALLLTLPGGMDSSGGLAAFYNPSDGQDYIAVSQGDEGRIRLFNARTGTPQGDFEIDATVAKLRAMELDDGRLLLVAVCRDGSIRVWNAKDITASPIVLRANEESGEIVKSCLFDSLSGRVCMLCVQYDGAGSMWDLGEARASGEVVLRSALKNG